MPKGPVTVRQIAALYIYDNQLYALEGNGKMVREALENSARYFLTCTGDCLQPAPKPSIPPAAQDFAALGEFRRPELNRKALDLLLDPGLDSRESIAILWRALGHAETREPSWQFFKANFDAIAVRLPREYLPVLPRAGADFCDAAHREEVRRFFSARAGKIEGAARPLAQTLESVDRCVALSGGQRAGVASFLKGY